MNDAVNGLGTVTRRTSQVQMPFCVNTMPKDTDPNNMTEQKHPSVLLERVV